MFNVYKGKDSPESNTIFCASHTAGPRGRGARRTRARTCTKITYTGPPARTARPVPSPQGPGARGGPAWGSRAGGAAARGAAVRRGYEEALTRLEAERELSSLSTMVCA